MAWNLNPFRRLTLDARRIGKHVRAMDGAERGFSKYVEYLLHVQ